MYSTVFSDWTVLLDVVAIVMSGGVILLLVLRRRGSRKKAHRSRSSAPPAAFTAEMSQQMMVQRYAASLEAIAGMIDAEKRALSEFSRTVESVDSPHNNNRRVPPDAPPDLAASADDRYGIVKQMTGSIAEARRMFKDGLATAAVAQKVQIPREGLDLLAKFSAVPIE